MKATSVSLSLLAAATLAVSGCSATQHRAEVQDDGIDRVSVGTVQREIRVGMPSAEVAEILGAPNIVSTDADRREVWIWDKLSSEVSYSRSSGVIAGLVVGTFPYSRRNAISSATPTPLSGLQAITGTSAPSAMAWFR